MSKIEKESKDTMDQDAATAKLMDRESAAWSAQAKELGL